MIPLHPTKMVQLQDDEVSHEVVNLHPSINELPGILAYNARLYRFSGYVHYSDCVIPRYLYSEVCAINQAS